MFPSEVFIFELERTIDCTRPSPITVDEITTLDHKVFNLWCVNSTAPYLHAEAHTTRWNLFPL